MDSPKCYKWLAMTMGLWVFSLSVYFVCVLIKKVNLYLFCNQNDELLHMIVYHDRVRLRC